MLQMTTRDAMRCGAVPGATDGGGGIAAWRSHDCRRRGFEKPQGDSLIAFALLRFP
jgi:hypothetical protein